MTGRLSGLLAVVGVSVVAAGLTVGSTLLPAATRGPVPMAQRLPISPSVPTLVCPGSETRLVPDGGLPVDAGAPVLLSALVSAPTGASAARLKLLGANPAPAAGPTPTPTPTPVSSSTAHAVVSATGRSLTLTSGPTGAAVGTLTANALGPVLLTAAKPAAGSQPTLAAVQSTLARTGNLRALAATSCTVPQADSWLVGGGTTDGERLRLLLANSAATPAVVDLDVHGPNGRVNAPSGVGVVVPPGAEVPIFIDALAPGLRRVAVHVTTRSGRIRATLYDSLLRGLVPAGADDVPVAATAAKRQVIPGVSLLNGDSRTAGDPTAAGSTAVRIAVPGAEEAVARIRLLGPAGEVDLPRFAVVTVPAGGVVDVPVAGVPPGDYTAVVDADVPVVAGALVGRPGTAGTVPASEFAWAASVSRLSGQGYAVLPPGTSSALSLAAVKASGRLVLTEVHADGTLGAPLDLIVPAGTAITQQLTPAAVAVQIGQVSGGPITASLVSTAADPRGTLITVLPVGLDPPAAPLRSALADSRLGLGTG